MKISRKIVLSMIFAFISIVSCFGLVACGSDNSIKITNDDGFAVVGEFEEGSVLETSVIDETSTEGKQVMSLIESEDYDEDKTVYIFEISVKKDGEKIQPNGKALVSVPVSADLTGYKVLHIKGGGKIESLSATYSNGFATFETSSFSTFVFVATGDVNINPTPVDGAMTKTQWDAAISFWKSRTNVKVVECFTSEANKDAKDTRIYQFESNKYSESAELDEGYKSKEFYCVKENDTYYSLEWYDYLNEGKGGWYKSDYLVQEVYSERVNQHIRNCTDFYAQPIDFAFENFTYDDTKEIYENNDKTINVAFTFESGTLTKMVVTVFINESGTIRTCERTITFGTALVSIPTSNITDGTTASK